MKVSYSSKTDYLEIFLKEDVIYYESSKDLGPVMEFLSEEDDSLVGYGVLDAYENIHHLPLDHKVKVAAGSWMIRKKRKLSQEELSIYAEKLELGTDFSKRTIQRIENAETDVSFSYLILLKKIDPDLNINEYACQLSCFSVESV